MRNLFTSLLVLVLVATPALAQSVTTTATPTTTGTTTTGTTTTPPVSNAPTTRTPLTQQQAQAYYQSCRNGAAAQGQLTPQTQDIFCQCTATYVQKNMSVEELSNAMADSPFGQEVRQKTTLAVYAPCMEFPVRDLIYSQCQANPQLAAASNVCACVSKNMAQYTAQSAQEKLGGLMKAGQDLSDPLNALMSTPEFTSQQQSIAMKCMTGAIQ